jgi:hypothetical protein
MTCPGEAVPVRRVPARGIYMTVQPPPVVPRITVHPPPVVPLMTVQPPPVVPRMTWQPPPVVPRMTSQPPPVVPREISWVFSCWAGMLIDLRAGEDLRCLEAGLKTEVDSELLGGSG